jgi:hypothetical protein
MEDMDVAAENRTDIEIHFITGLWRVRVELIEKEATDELRIKREVDMGGESFQL